MINLHIALAYKYQYLPDALFHMDNRRFSDFQRRISNFDHKLSVIVNYFTVPFKGSILFC